MRNIIAIDLGASSGRLILGYINEARHLSIKEIYRFPNFGIKVNNSLYWDVLYLFKKIKIGLKKYVEEYGSEVESIGIDTWGVDFVLLDENDEFIGPLYHYRDKRTSGMIEEMCKIVPKKIIFNKTGIQFLELNTSTQLFSMIFQKSPRLKITKSILMLPDFFNFLLSGVKLSEISDASTSQLFNPRNFNWDFELIEKLGLNPSWFQKIFQGGKIIGKIKKDIAYEVGLNENTKIIAPLTHDTASAFAAVPVNNAEYEMGEYGIISSGTWSLIGVELKKPIINDKALKYNFTNEIGFNNSIRFLKNVAGLWLIQECKRIWDENGKYLTWDDILREAIKAQQFKFMINPDDKVFLNPPNMIEAIKNYCKRTNQPQPNSIGEISRTIFESLSLRYRQIKENLEEIINNKIKIFHIIGGGSRNELLNQFTANALGIPIRAGPSEATAIGNILVQALALGIIKDINEMREIIRTSFEIKQYNPKNIDKWNEAYKKYLKIIEI
ncbi:MAG: rhamnulokinase [Promethearchaeia archaeon]